MESSCDESHREPSNKPTLKCRSLGGEGRGMDGYCYSLLDYFKFPGNRVKNTTVPISWWREGRLTYIGLKYLKKITLCSITGPISVV